jgi:GntR family transcriptional regulator
MEINRDSATPLHAQLRHLLAQRIESGEYARGTCIPSELDLAHGLGLSRATVRQAINSLVRDGLLFRVVGKGTYVLGSRREPSLVERLTSFADDMETMRIPYTTKVLNREVVPASEAYARLLSTEPGAPLFVLERLRFVRDDPFYVTVSYISLAMCPGVDRIDFGARPLFRTIREMYGYHIARATRSLQAVVANEHEALAMNVPRGFPLHLVEDVVYLDDGRPIMFTRSRYRGDLSEFTFEVRFRQPV